MVSFTPEIPDQAPARTVKRMIGSVKLTIGITTRSPLAHVKGVAQMVKRTIHLRYFYEIAEAWRSTQRYFIENKTEGQTHTHAVESTYSASTLV